MATLYELGEAEKQLIDLFEVDDIDEQTLNDTIESLDIGGKLEDYCMVLRQMEADVKVFKEEAAYFATKQKRAENGIKWLKGGILNYMALTGKKKVEAGLFKISTRESKVVNIVDEDLIPKEYKVEQLPKIDKAGIRKALLSGVDVEGAEIQINTSVQVK